MRALEPHRVAVEVQSELLAKSFSAGDLLCTTPSYAPSYTGAQDQASGAARIF